ncbi:endodeoxyribonuclease [Borealophlyctis nickersoniae]|nr:endodeoxyribonuclease [Borealophlyctis nickersoniae]
MPPSWIQLVCNDDDHAAETSTASVPDLSDLPDALDCDAAAESLLVRYFPDVTDDSVSATRKRKERDFGEEEDDQDPYGVGRRARTNREILVEREDDEENAEERELEEREMEKEMDMDTDEKKDTPVSSLKMTAGIESNAIDSQAAEQSLGHSSLIVTEEEALTLAAEAAPPNDDIGSHCSSSCLLFLSEEEHDIGELEASSFPSSEPELEDDQDPTYWVPELPSHSKEDSPPFTASNFSPDHCFEWGTDHHSPSWSDIDDNDSPLEHHSPTEWPEFSPASTMSPLLEATVDFEASASESEGFWDLDESSPPEADTNHSLHFEASDAQDIWDEEFGEEEPWESLGDGAIGNELDGFGANEGDDEAMDIGQLAAENAQRAVQDTVIAVGTDSMSDVDIGVYWQTTERSRGWMLQRLNLVLNDIQNARDEDSIPVLKLLSRNKKAWTYDETTKLMRLTSRSLAFKKIRGDSPRFDVYVRILEICRDLLEDGIVATKRDIYYRDVALFRSQQIVDQVVEDLACTFAVPRHCLHVVAASKGLVHGDLRIIMKDGSVTDCSTGGDQLETDARFVLVIEKEATFRTVLASKFSQGPCGPCIIITGKGYPDVSTRRLVKHLSEIVQIVPTNTVSQSAAEIASLLPSGTSCEPLDGESGFWTPDDEYGVPIDFEMDEMGWGSGDSRIELQSAESVVPDVSDDPDNDDGDAARVAVPMELMQEIRQESRIPVLCLVDCDPHGLDIFLCYKIGSRAMAFDALNLATPRIRLLGLCPKDWTSAGVDLDKLPPLTDRDRKKAISMLSRKSVQDCVDLRRDLQKMLFYGRKAEIQAVDTELLVEGYLPFKINHLTGRV